MDKKINSALWFLAASVFLFTVWYGYSVYDIGNRLSTLEDGLNFNSILNESYRIGYVVDSVNYTGKGMYRVWGMRQAPAEITADSARNLAKIFSRSRPKWVEIRGMHGDVDGSLSTGVCQKKREIYHFYVDGRYCGSDTVEGMSSVGLDSCRGIWRPADTTEVYDTLYYSTLEDRPLVDTIYVTDTVLVGYIDTTSYSDLYSKPDEYGCQRRKAIHVKPKIRPGLAPKWKILGSEPVCDSMTTPICYKVICDTTSVIAPDGSVYSIYLDPSYWYGIGGGKYIHCDTVWQGDVEYNGPDTEKRPGLVPVMGADNEVHYQQPPLEYMGCTCDTVDYSLWGGMYKPEPYWYHIGGGWYVHCDTVWR